MPSSLMGVAGIATSTYRPDQWHDFFLLCGTGAASLAGLVFVAMSLNLAAIARDPTHRNRAVGTLTSLSAVFMMCTLALIGGQGHVGVGVELLTLSALAGGVFLKGYITAARSGRRGSDPSLRRTVGGTSCYVVAMFGATALIAGAAWGLTVVAVAVVANFYFMISGAWLLLVGISQEERPSDR